MKTNLLKTVILVVTIGLPLMNFTQWNQNLSANDRWGKTVDVFGSDFIDIRRIGIGNFILNGYGGPKAALHVNENLLTDLIPTASNYFTPGHLFRTDGPSDMDNMWQLFTGPDASATEKARFSVPANTNDLVIEACMGHSNIRFNLVHNRQRAILTDGHGQGHLGVGDNFSDPQHMIHVHTSPTDVPTIPPSDIGFTNSNIGATENDGFIAGIELDGTAFINQQEDRDIIISTNAGTQNDQRMIISHDDVTNDPRVGIGNNNLADPRTFLHIGYNIANNSGYRNWMNVGEMAVNDKGDNMYFGFSGRMFGSSDHVINWGSEEIQNEKNRLRFVNTTNPSNTETSGEPTGLEIARMVAIDGTDARMGIGDFFTIAEDPTQVLDVIGNARLRELPATSWQDETLTKCVVVDDDGVLHWRNFDGGGSGGSLGNICAAPTSNPLLNDWEIPLNDHNFVFSGQESGTNRVGIGTDCSPNAKLDVLQEHNDVGINALINSGEPNSTAIIGESDFADGQTGVTGIVKYGVAQFGVMGIADGLDAFDSKNYGVYGTAFNAHTNTGVGGIVHDNNSEQNYGGYFIADGGIHPTGIYSRCMADDNTFENIGGHFVVYTGGSIGLGDWNYAIKASAIDATNSYAGYFDGNVNVDGDLTIFGASVTPSDEQFKENITAYSGALAKVRDLNPVTFNYDTASFDLNFPVGLQYGLISNDVEQVIPELVSNNIIPPEVDSAGNIINDSISYKGLNYLELTPILTQAIKELDDTIHKIIAKPDTPILIAPENNDTILAKEIPEFIWHKADHAQFYTLYLSYTADMSDVFLSASTVDTLINPKISIRNDTAVYWAVKAYNTFGESDFSEIRYVFLAYGFDKTKAQSISKLSDANLKTNVNDIDDALTKIMQLNGISFEWDTEQNPDRNLSDGTHLGLIAQEVQPIFPEVVSTDINGYLYIDYSSLVAVLIESVKDLKYINDSLAQRLNDVEIRIDNIEQLVYEDLGDAQMKNTNEPSFQQEVTLENTKAIVLNQNVPNPFKEQTTISFQIPDNIVSAKIIFIDNLGNILKQVEITDRGYGELIVYAHDLSAGHYTYYLIADGNTIESKKMVLTK